MSDFPLLAGYSHKPLNHTSQDPFGCLAGMLFCSLVNQNGSPEVCCFQGKVWNVAASWIQFSTVKYTLPKIAQQGIRTNLMNLPYENCGRCQQSASVRPLNILHVSLKINSVYNLPYQQTLDKTMKHFPVSEDHVFFVLYMVIIDHFSVLYLHTAEDGNINGGHCLQNFVCSLRRCLQIYNCKNLQLPLVTRMLKEVKKKYNTLPLHMLVCALCELLLLLQRATEETEDELHGKHGIIHWNVSPSIQCEKCRWKLRREAF